MANPNPRQIEIRKDAVALFGGGPLFPYYFAALDVLKRKVSDPNIQAEAQNILRNEIATARADTERKITEEERTGPRVTDAVRADRIAKAEAKAEQDFNANYFQRVLPTYKNELACAIMGATFVTERRALEEARDKADKAATDNFSEDAALAANPFMLEASQLWRRFLYGADTTNSAEHLAALRNNTTEGNAENVQWFIGQLRALNATLPANSSIRDLTPNQFSALFAKNQIQAASPTAAADIKWSLYELLRIPEIKNNFATQIGVANAADLTPDNLFEKILNHLGDPGSPQELERAQKLLETFSDPTVLETLYPSGTPGFEAKRDAFKAKIGGELNVLLEARRIPLVNNSYIADTYVTPIATAANKIKDAAGQYIEPYKALREAAITANPGSEADITNTENLIAGNRNYQLATPNPYLEPIGTQLRTFADAAGFIPTNPAISNTDYAINVFRTASAGVNFNELSDTARQAKIFSAIQQLSTQGNALSTLISSAPAKQVVADALGINADTLTVANLAEKLVEAEELQITQLTDGLAGTDVPPARIEQIENHITQLRATPRVAAARANLANFYATQIPQRPNVTKALLNAPDRQQLIQTVHADNQSFEQNFQYSNLDVRAQAEIRASAVYAEMLEQQITVSDAALAADPNNETLQKNKQQLVTQKNYVDNFRNNVGLYRTSLERADAGLPLIEPARTPSFGERIWMRLKPSIFNTDSYRRSAYALTMDQSSAAYTNSEGFKQTVGRTVINTKADVVEERIRVTDLQGKPVGERLNFVSDTKAFLNPRKRREEENVNGVPTMVEKPSEMENSAVKCLSHGFNNGGMLTYDPAEKKFQLPPPGLNFDKKYYDVTLKKIDDPMVRLFVKVFSAITAVEALAFNATALAISIPFRALASGVSALFGGNPIDIMPNTRPLLESFRNRVSTQKESSTNELQQALVNLWFQEKLTEPTTVTQKDPQTGKDVQVPIPGLLSKSHCVSADVKKAKQEITSDGEGKKVYDQMNAKGGLLKSLDDEFNQRLQALESKQDPTKINSNKANNCRQVMADMLKNRNGTFPDNVVKNYVNLLEDQINRPNSSASNTTTVQSGRARP